MSPVHCGRGINRIEACRGEIASASAARRSFKTCGGGTSELGRAGGRADSHPKRDFPLARCSLWCRPSQPHLQKREQRPNGCHCHERPEWPWQCQAWPPLLCQRPDHCPIFPVSPRIGLYLRHLEEAFECTIEVKSGASWRLIYRIS